MQTPDYYPVLRKAVASLDRSDRAARDALYQRAGRALVNQLRSSDPPLPDSEIDTQVDALRAAITRIEDEFEDERGGQPAPQTVAPARGAPSATAAPTRRRYRIAAAGALAVLAIAGLGTYFAVSRNRAAPPSVGQRETVRPSAVAPAAKGSADPAHASYILRQQRVYYRTTQPAGTVIVARNQRFLYLVQANQVAIRYAIAVGPECDGIGGLFRITAKVGEPGQAEASNAQASSRAGTKPAFDPPALYFGGAHAVHRASEPGRIGQAAPRGCFHAWSQDIADLYERIPIDERVVVAN